MKTAIVASAFCILVAGVAGAAESRDPSAPGRGNTAFAVKLYRSLSAEGGNVFVSPFSLSTTLAMVYAGARGATAGQFAQVLAAGPDPALFHKSFGQLNAWMLADCKQEQCVLRTANAVWVRKGLPLLKSYSEVLRTAYAAKAAEVDFAAMRKPRAS